MSTPVPPPVPNEPEPGNQPPAPRYGENSPQPGQNAPQYGQNAPEYGQNPPAAPQYGQNAPQYGQNALAGTAVRAERHRSSASPLPGLWPAAVRTVPLRPVPFGKAAGHRLQWRSPAGEHLLLAPDRAPLRCLSFPCSWASRCSTTRMMRSAFDDAMRSSGATGTEFNYEDFKGVLAGMLVVLAILGAGLYLLVAFFIRKGKNWARILGTVFARSVRFQPLPGTEHRDLGNAGGHCGDRAAVPASRCSLLPQAAAVRQPLHHAGQPVRTVSSTQYPTPQRAWTPPAAERVPRRSGPGSAPVVRGRPESAVRWPCPPCGG